MDQKRWLALAWLVPPLMSLAAEGDVPSAMHQAFVVQAPVEFQGIWQRPPAPFLHPVETSNWVNVRVEEMDPASGRIAGHFDVYVRSICDDIVDEPFVGTFDGQVLRLQYEYRVCPLMKPLHLAIWKDQGGFRGKVNRREIVIRRVIEGHPN